MESIIEESVNFVNKMTKIFDNHMCTMDDKRTLLKIHFVTDADNIKFLKDHKFVLEKNYMITHDLENIDGYLIYNDLD